MALNIYKTEFNKHPFPRSKKSVEALAFGEEVSLFDYAEAFILIKRIEK